MRRKPFVSPLAVPANRLGIASGGSIWEKSNDRRWGNMIPLLQVIDFE
jgi:hypothetical protein